MPLIPASSEGTRQDPGFLGESNKACGQKVYLFENSYILLNNACCFSEKKTNCRSVSFFCVVRADEKGTVEGAEEPCSLVGVAPVPKASL